MTKYIAKKGYDFCVKAIFTFFLLYLFFQYQLVYLYYDDFGYCSLSYGYNAGISGTDITFKSAIDFLAHSYTMVNGRIFTNLMIVLVAALGDVQAMRLFMPLCVWGIYLLIYFIIKKNQASGQNRVIAALILTLSYGLFNSNIVKHGLYWFAAAFGYVLPVFLFFILMKIYTAEKCVFFLPILAFLLCISAEQTLAMTLCFILTHMLCDFLQKKKIILYHWLAFFGAVCGSAVMVLSPASRGRLTSENNIAFYEKNLFEKINGNIEILIDMFFNLLGPGIVFLFISICLYLSIQLFLESKHKVLHVLFALYALCISGIYIINKMTFPSGYSIFAALFFIAAFGEIIFYYSKEQKEKIAWIISGAASVGILLIVPEIPARTFLPFLFILFLIAGDLIFANYSGKSTFVFYLLCIPLCVFSWQNTGSIYKGYKENSFILTYNECQLREASDKIANNQFVDKVELYRLPDLRYAGQQVYDENVSFMKFWIDEYYNLPYEIEYIYYDYPNGENATSICHVR